MRHCRNNWETERRTQSSAYIMIEKAVGIIGGIGPMSTVYFMEMIINMTDATKDQEHINMVVLNHATIPDRTSYILGKSSENPLAVMVEDAKKLQQAGADFIVIPCNTAHYFFEEIKKSISIPMINIVEETVQYACRTIPDLKKLGVLATTGTVQSSTYQIACEKQGIECVVPDVTGQEMVMKIIYEQVKAGKEIDIALFYHLVETLKEKGCQAVVLGCTELSVVKRDFHIKRTDIIDSLEVLAMKTIITCGKKLKREELSPAPYEEKAKGFVLPLS